MAAEGLDRSDEQCAAAVRRVRSSRELRREGTTTSSRNEEVIERVEADPPETRGAFGSAEKVPSHGGVAGTTVTGAPRSASRNATRFVSSSARETERRVEDGVVSRVDRDGRPVEEVEHAEEPALATVVEVRRRVVDAAQRGREEEALIGSVPRHVGPPFVRPARHRARGETSRGCGRRSPRRTRRCGTRCTAPCPGRQPAPRRRRPTSPSRRPRSSDRRRRPARRPAERTQRGRAPRASRPRPE